MKTSPGFNPQRPSATLSPARRLSQPAAVALVKAVTLITGAVFATSSCTSAGTGASNTETEEGKSPTLASSPQTPKPAPTKSATKHTKAGPDGCWTTKVTETSKYEGNVYSDTTVDKFCVPTTTERNAEGLQSATFSIPKSPEHGKVDIAVFYAGNTIKAANKTLRGSNRGFGLQFEPKFDRTRDLANVHLDFQTGLGTVTASPTCEILDSGSVECTDGGAFTSIPEGSNTTTSPFAKGNQVLLRNYNFRQAAQPADKGTPLTLTTYLVLRDPKSPTGAATAVAVNTDLYPGGRPCTYGGKTANADMEIYSKLKSDKDAGVLVFRQPGDSELASTLSGKILFNDAFYENAKVNVITPSSFCP